MAQLVKYVGLTGLMAVLGSAIQIGDRPLFEVLMETESTAVDSATLSARAQTERDVTVGRISPAATVPPPPEVAAAEEVAEAELGRVLERTEGWLAEARFRAALVELETVRPATHQAAPPEKARLEVLTATAQLALGRGDQAAESLRRALVADAELALDPSTTPPKVRRLLAEVRREQRR